MSSPGTALSKPALLRSAALVALSILGVLGSSFLSLTVSFAPLLIASLPWFLLVLLLSWLPSWFRPFGALQRWALNLVLVASLYVFSVLLTDWPFRTALALSRGALSSAGSAISAGVLPQGHRLGLFPIRRIEPRSDGVVTFWTDLSEGGRSGFVYSPTGALPFNLWSSQPLYRSWYFIAED